jgi:hypothetical protein
MDEILKNNKKRSPNKLKRQFSNLKIKQKGSVNLR